jgi:hypothetical protein
MLKPVAYLVLLASSALLLLEGCSDRRAAEAQFLGTWSRASFDSTADLSFYPDHTFILSGESLGQYTVFDRGTWYLDYKRIFLRRKNRDENALIILNVSDVTGDQLSIAQSDHIETYKREKTKTPDEIAAMDGQRVEYTITR